VAPVTARAEEIITEVQAKLATAQQSILLSIEKLGIVALMMREAPQLENQPGQEFRYFT
jgi:hypothetical protein